MSVLDCSTMEPGAWNSAMSCFAEATMRPATSKMPTRALPVPTSTPMTWRALLVAPRVGSFEVMWLRLSHRSEIDAVGKDHEVADRHAARARQHEEHRIGNLLRLHQAARRQRLVHLRLRPVVEKRRDDRARGHCAHPHTVPGDLAAGRLPERPHRGPGGGVVRL